MWKCVHDWSKCFGRPVSGVEGVFALERAGWGDTHATNLVVVCRCRALYAMQNAEQRSEIENATYFLFRNNFSVFSPTSAKSTKKHWN